MSADTQDAKEERAMNTTVTASIEPRFRTIDGLRIRYADSGGSHGARRCC